MALLDERIHAEKVSADTSFRVHVLGAFRLTTLCGRPISVRSRKARALITYLTLSGGRGGREQIAALLWSDRGEEQARASLRQTLHEIRRLDWRVAMPPLAADNEVVTLSPELVGSDLEALRVAASEGDVPAVMQLVGEAAADGRLLCDLDGLDPEFDHWLRQLRAREPGDVLDRLLASAERDVAENRLPEARTLLAAIESWDPAREDVARLQLRVAEGLGELESLERRWDRLVQTLAADFGTSPSPATESLYRELKQRAPATPPPPPRPAAKPAVPAPLRSAWRDKSLAVALAVLTMLTATAALWWGEPPSASSTTGSPIVAVLPFEHGANQPPFLASGLWDEVRTALARNTRLRLLGRTTIDANAAANLSSVQWRQRTGADFVLAGAIRTEGDRLLLRVELSRTSDGLLLWQEEFRAPLDRPGEIAAAVEGQLRSRLAPGGGRRAAQIATSATVQALYREARALLAARRYEDHVRARHLLRDAVARDPNYAPAWAALAKAAYLVNSGVIDDAALRDEARRASRRAIILAPELAEAHAVAGLIEGESSAIGLAHLQRAVRLDPSNIDAWNWLGNSLNRRGDPEAALNAYATASRLDPLFWPVLTNMAQTAGDMGRPALIDELLARAERAGAEPDVLASLRAFRALAESDLSRAAQALSNGAVDDQGRSRPAALMAWVETLEKLDLLEPLHKLVDCPPWYPDLLRGRIEPPTMVDNRPVKPAEFWTSFYFSYAASRSLFNHGKTAQLVRLYRDGFRDADAFIAETRRTQQLTGLAPTLAMALQAEGQPQEARYLLAAAERDMGDPRRNFRRDELADLAAIKAAQGEHQQGLTLLERAIARGWLPGGRTTPLDIRFAPAFSRLRNAPRFQAARAAILATVKRERTEMAALPLVLGSTR